MNPKIQKSWRQLPHFTVLSFFPTNPERTMWGARVIILRPFTPTVPFTSVLAKTRWVGPSKLTLSREKPYWARETLLGTSLTPSRNVWRDLWTAEKPTLTKENDVSDVSHTFEHFYHLLDSIAVTKICIKRITTKIALRHTELRVDVHDNKP